MSRNSYQARRDTEVRWPELYQFLAGYLHQDAVLDYGSQGAAVDRAIEDRALNERQEIARQWRDWNQTAGVVDDVRPAVEALGVADGWFEPKGARDFMNSVYDKLIVSIRREAGKDWKP